MADTPDELPAISVRQPWAHAILHLGKTIENRAWRTSYRGPLLIHAARKIDPEGELHLRAWLHESGNCNRLARAEDMTRGALVGIAQLVDIVRDSDSPWFSGPFGFVLEEIRAFDPIPYMGKQKLFGVPIAFLPPGTISFPEKVA